MLRFRPYLNSDPPLLTAVWRGCVGRRGLAQPITTAMLDQLVLSKPYFDRTGLILALDDDRPVGFVHAGFGPNEDESGLSTDLGVVVMLLVVSHPDESAIAARLVAMAEDYLRSKGAKVIYGGGVRPLVPFYWGLYGGSELPGVLDSDPQAQAVFRAAGYREMARTVILHRDLSGFRPCVDRRQMQIRRSTEVETVVDPPPRSWWEACVMNQCERTTFRLRPHGGCELLAQMTCWNIEPFAAPWGVRASGLIDLVVTESHRRRGMATYLVGETLRQLQEQSFALVEAQTMDTNTSALALYRKLGFKQVDSGVVFRKEGAGISER
ncbi:MAG TPA: GNAT family N-acetyltransferase [Pirellulales bacterium]|nr:GNAT family N-acetyltransferase [Pirellulales bacterium]